MGHAAAELVDQLAQGDADGRELDAGILDASRHREAAQAVALVAAVVRQAGDEDERLGRSLAPLVTHEDEEPLERAAVLLALADEITERTPPGGRAVLDCRVRGDQVVVAVKALPSWSVRGVGDRFEAAFGRKLRMVPGAPRRR